MQGQSYPQSGLSETCLVVWVMSTSPPHLLKCLWSSPTSTSVPGTIEFFLWVKEQPSQDVLLKKKIFPREYQVKHTKHDLPGWFCWARLFTPLLWGTRACVHLRLRGWLWGGLGKKRQEGNPFLCFSLL